MDVKRKEDRGGGNESKQEKAREVRIVLRNNFRKKRFSGFCLL